MAAVNAPRIHHQLIPDIVYAEEQRCLLDGPLRRVPEEQVAGLRARGHQVEYHGTGKTAVTQLIVVDPDTGRVHAVSDARKGGYPAAY